MNFRVLNFYPKFSCIVTIHLIFCCIESFFVANAGTIDYFSECPDQKAGPYKLESGGINSTLSIQFVEINEEVYDATFHCTVILQPPENYGLTIFVEIVNFQKFLSNSGCKGYVEVLQDSSESTKIPFNERAIKVIRLYYSKQVEIVYFLNCSAAATNGANIDITATAFRSGNVSCADKEYQCPSDECIWEGLLCDGNPNCADQTDENDSKCDGIQHGKVKSIWNKVKNKVKKIKFKPPPITTFRRPTYRRGNGGSLSPEGTKILIGVLVGVLSFAIFSYVLYKCCCSEQSSTHVVNRSDHPVSNLPTIMGSNAINSHANTKADYTDPPPSYFEVTSSTFPLPSAPAATDNRIKS